MMTWGHNALVDKIETYASTVNYHVLTDSEAELVKDILEDETQAISQINEKIAALAAERERHKERIKKIHIALAPHRSLPPELLAEIFVRCLPTPTDDNPIIGPPSTERNETPWSLGQVCSAWRAISRGDHRLWRDMVMDAGYYGDDERAKRCLIYAHDLLPPFVLFNMRLRITGYEYGRLWRHTSPNHFQKVCAAEFHISGGVSYCIDEPRSDGRKIEFALHGAHHLRSIEIKETNLLLGHLASAIPWHQLTNLKLNGYRLTPSSVVPVLQKCAALEVLHLNFNTFDNDGDLSPDSCIDLPSLHTLTIHRDDIMTPLLPWFNPLGHVTHLDLRGFRDRNGKRMFELLKYCSNLKALRLGEPYDMEQVPAQQLVFPQLESLVIEDIEENEWLPGALLVPALRRLKLKCFYSGCPVGLSSIRELVINSKCCLTTLIMKQDPRLKDENASAIQDLLAAVPTLVHLELIYPPLTQDTRCDLAAGTILPHLEYLRCVVASGDDFLHMVETRAERDWRQGRNVLCEVEGIGAQWSTDADAAAASIVDRLAKLRRQFGVQCSLAWEVAAVSALEID